MISWPSSFRCWNNTFRDFGALALWTFRIGVTVAKNVYNIADHLSVKECEPANHYKVSEEFVIVDSFYTDLDFDFGVYWLFVKLSYVESQPWKFYLIDV